VETRGVRQEAAVAIVDVRICHLEGGWMSSMWGKVTGQKNLVPKIQGKFFFTKQK